MLVLYSGDITAEAGPAIVKVRKKNKKTHRDASSGVRFQTSVAATNKECNAYRVWMGMLRGGGGEGIKSLNMLLPWGRTTAHDPEKPSRVMGILK